VKPLVGDSSDSREDESYRSDVQIYSTYWFHYDDLTYIVMSVNTTDCIKYPAHEMDKPLKKSAAIQDIKKLQ
jgi:hypothetical protein